MIITCPRCTASYTVDVSAFGNASRTVKCSACDWQWVQTVAARESPGPPPPTATPLPSDDQHEEKAVATEEKVAWADDPEPEPDIPPIEPPSADAHPLAAEGNPPADDDGQDDVDFAVEMAPEDAEPEQSTPEPSEPEAPVRQPWVAGRGLLALVAGIATVAVLLCGLLLVRGTIVQTFPQSAGFYRLLGLSVDNAGAGLDIREVTSSREWIDGQEMLVVSGTIANVATAAIAVPSLKVALHDGSDRALQSVLLPASGKVLLAGETTRFEVRLPSPPEAAQRIKITFEPEG